MHRDLKPDNILGVRIGGGITWKLADFGLAKLLTGDARGRYYAESKCGTEIYMAPEVNNYQVAMLLSSYLKELVKRNDHNDILQLTLGPKK